MDDFIILLPDKNSCIKLMNMISDFLAKKLRLELNDKSRYFPNKMGVNLCKELIHGLVILLIVILIDYNKKF